MLVDASAEPPAPEIHETGEHLTEARPGSLLCVACGFAISAASPEALPHCPNCGGTRFRRGSIFAQPVIKTELADTTPEVPAWLEEIRSQLDSRGHYMAWESYDGAISLVRLEVGWTRIGRSGAAEIRLDDATVSRRHALVVLSAEGELKALDDRSMNGLFVNGERVEWAALEDGHELEVGRFKMHVLVN